MNTEIIKTDNPNIVVERTIIDKEINIEELIKEKEQLESFILNTTNLIDNLREQSKNLSIEIKQLIESDILQNVQIIENNKQRLITITNILNNL